MLDVTIRITEHPDRPGLSATEQAVLAALGGQTAVLGTVEVTMDPDLGKTSDEETPTPEESVEREPGKPRPGRKRRTAAEVAEDEAREAALRDAYDPGPAEDQPADDEEPEEPAESAEDPDAEVGAADPEPDEEPEDDTPDEDEVDKTSVEYAVSVASDLLDQDKVAEVKAALKEFGIRKVSLLKKSQVPDFLAALGHG